VSSIDLAHEPDIEISGVLISPPTREVIAGGGVRETLEPRVMQVLVALAKRRGEVVSRAELIATCWGGRIVGEAVIYRCIAAIRRLGEKHGGFTLSTVARVGYRLDTIGAPTRSIEPLPTPRARRATLIGREREMTDLGALLGALTRGAGGMALVSGEAGVGKTRLCDEAGERARRAGAFVVKGRCYAGPTTEPYGPFIEILEAFIRTGILQDLRVALGEDAPVLARLLPELSRRFPDVAIEPEPPREQRRRQVASALAGFFARAALSRPLVLILDDLHWIDEDTAYAIRHLGHRLGEAPIIVLGTHRDLEREMSAAFTEFLEECVRQRGVELLALKGLSQGQTADLVAALASRPFVRGKLVGPDPPSAQVGAIYAATQGNPFFIEEVVRHLADENRLLDADGCIRNDIRMEELGISEGVRIVITKRVGRLSDTARRLLPTAAIVGPRFAVELLEALDLGDTDQILDALGEAESAGLVQQEAGRYGFAHDLIRQAVLAAIPAPRQRRLHRQVAEAIERLYPGAPGELALEIGHHLARADAPDGDPTQTIDRLRQAAELAYQVNDFAESVAAYDAALALLPPGRPTDRAELLAGRSESSDRAGYSSVSIPNLEEAISIYAEVGDADAVARVSTLLVHRYWMALRAQDGLAVSRSAVAGLGGRRTRDRAILLAWQGLFLILLRQHAAGEAAFNEAERLAAELDDPDAIAWVCDRRARAHMDLDERRDAAVWGIRAGEAAKRSSQPGLAGPNLAIAAGALFKLGRWDEALAALDEAERVSELSGTWHVTMHCQFTRGAIISLREARFADDNDRTYLRNARGLGVDAQALSILASGLKQIGRWEEAAQAYEQALQSNDRDTRVSAWGGLMLMKARLGDRAGAETMLAERWSATDSQPKYERRIAHSWPRDFAIAETLVVLGRDREAGRFYDVFLEYSRRNCPIEGLLGITAAAAGKWAEAEAHFADALADAERLPNRVAQAEHRVDWACALLRRAGEHHRTRAFELLGEAADRYAQMGMQRHQAETLKVIDAHS
jgi:predicted ATPase/DNA-binding winged helix-turn-helix (wHTH) protein